MLFLFTCIYIFRFTDSERRSRDRDPASIAASPSGTQGISLVDFTCGDSRFERSIPSISLVLCLQNIHEVSSSS